MKKLILTTLMSVAAVSAFSQGSLNFLNDPGTLTSPPDRLVRFGPLIAAQMGIANGTAAFGTNYQVQLYYGASTATDASLIPVTAGPARLRPSTSASPGIWLGGGLRTLNGFDFASGQVKLQVRVWDIAFGTSYEAQPGAGVRGVSQSFLFTMPSSASAPLGDFAMVNFGGFNIDIIPEPSTLALAGLGTVAMLIFRRKK